MKPIKSSDDILLCIEGITNDFEEYLSTKVETNNAILELVLHVAELAQEKSFTLKNIINYSIWRSERTVGYLKMLIPELINEEQVLRYWMDNVKTKPVRLTEDHLIKFGFSTDDLGDDFTPEEYQYPLYRKGMVKIEYNRNGGYFKSENLVSIDLIEYNFVHELQNLYYFLTGEDLKWEQ